VSGKVATPRRPVNKMTSRALETKSHRAEGVLVCSNEKAPNSVGAFSCVAGVHPPYAAEAFLFTPLRVATVLSLVFAAFSSLRFVVRRRTTSSWPSSSAHAISVP
jgi:hypothetical protein